VISNVDAAPHSDPAEIRELLVKQLVSPVQWEESMRRMLGEHGVERAYEIGPGRVLTGLMKRIDRKFACENVAA
jgi:[acyl-carrier-protein] S-malonyltransferase